MRPKQKFTKTISLVLCVLLLLSSITFGQAVPMNTDIKGHWAEVQINSWISKGFISTYADGSFKPNAGITRAELAGAVNKAFGFTQADVTNFTDVKVTDSFYNDMSIAKKAGYLIGTGNGTVKPNSVMTRQEFAIIISRLMKLPKPASISAVNVFTDVKMIPAWGIYEIESIVAKGYMIGTPQKTFNPIGIVTRAETITALNRCYLEFIALPDTTPPVIQLIGLNPASVAVKDPTFQNVVAYADPGAVATDNVSGNLTSKITVTGTVNTAAVGSYILTYSVADAAGNVASTTRTVNVVARLNAAGITKFVTPLLVPWAMPKSIDPNPTANTDYYEIAMRQFKQQVLPTGLPMTTVWGYGTPGGVFNAPSLTIEATANKPVRVKWINDLKDANGNYLPHLLSIDQTLDWANPAGTAAMGGMTAPKSPLSYVGPVPIVTHVHGAHVVAESDGYPLAWYMPNAKNMPANYMTEGPSYAPYKATAQSGANWTPGSAVYDYANDQRDATIWYHDHAMGMTRNNVYTGPAGFYLIRGNTADTVINTATNQPAVLPGPAPMTMAQAQTAANGAVYEIPIAIQDRSFNSDGSLYYPNTREAFDGFAGPYAPGTDMAPIWNPETFGDTIIVNGNTWPTQNVQPKRYRLRFLNGSQARTFILKFSNNMNFTQIGSDQGFLAATAVLPELLMGPAERADVIVDFTGMAAGTSIILKNLGPDEPYQGGVPGDGITPGTFVSANPATTGNVMEFKVIASDGTPDLSTNPSNLKLPTIAAAAAVNVTRKLSLNEMDSMNATMVDPATGMTIPAGPQSAMLGTVATGTGGVLTGVPMTFMAPVTESIKLNNTEVWEVYNFTADAHPIHLHLVGFEVVNRQVFDPLTGALGAITQPNTWETGYKDTVMAFPGQVTRFKAKFDIAGRYVWHCHILEHEDNEMMRPYDVK